MLGIDRSSSQEEIEKAYRKKALEHHPDRNPGDASAHEKFLKIQEAYDVLKDKSKRLNYDNNLNGFNESFFHVENENLDIRISINFSIYDSILGKQKTLKISRANPCGDCSGKGYKTFDICNNCNGSGAVITMPNPFFNFRTLCGKCVGKGRIPKDSCGSCFGQKYKPMPEEEVSYTIPKGLLDGMGLCLKGMGNFGVSGNVGNLYIDCRLEQDPNYKVDGLNLISTKKIKYSTLIFGGKIEVPTPDGDIIVVDIPSSTECLTKFTIKNKGLFDIRDIKKRGDLIVSTVVAIPKKIENAEILRKILEENGI